MRSGQPREPGVESHSEERAEGDHTIDVWGPVVLEPSPAQESLQGQQRAIKLASLVFCDTLDELYHGLYDASLISALRTGVFLGIVTDAFKKTWENVRSEDEARIDEIIGKYLVYKNQKEKIEELQEEVDLLEREIDNKKLFDEFMEAKIQQQNYKQKLNRILDLQ
eukprot:CAMPEP_0168609926 /NCGR_PEP_ID=MMETSP0449_2-20121227/1488_1 /TAXON_ID=1082188 /ORGANISM="Strombidium rassoulzadegani, Strain ras09" /LENGTH=165 /DNA_ID=CAMNT_0008650145 /DNA_START=955 /DNA_END=1454 /DNA_ORIENTATION=+